MFWAEENIPMSQRPDNLTAYGTKTLALHKNLTWDSAGWCLLLFVYSIIKSILMCFNLMEATAQDVPFT